MTHFEELPPKYITCSDCGDPARRRSGSQKYCERCSTKHDRQRKAQWAREHPKPETPAEQRDRYRRRRDALMEAGAASSSARDIAWAAEDVDVGWIVRVAVPFSYAFSKNHIWQMGRKGHIHLGEEHKAARTMLALHMRQALGERRIAQNRLWLDLLVQKPDHKGDAVNVIDGVCDALKEVIDLDDRWYSIRRLDWEIVKDNPMLYVGISQDDVTDVQPCSYCGRLLPFDAFGANKSTRTGRARGCIECTRAADAIRRERKRRAA